MPLNPNVILAQEPLKVPTPADMFKTQALEQENAMRQDEMNATNAMRREFSQMDPNEFSQGNIPMNALRNIMAVSPTAGIKLMGEMEQARYRNMLMKKAQSDIDSAEMRRKKDRLGTYIDIFTTQDEAYRNAAKNGGTDPMDAANRAALDRMELIRKSGLMDDRDVADLRQDIFAYDPVAAPRKLLEMKDVIRRHKAAEDWQYYVSDSAKARFRQNKEGALEVAPYGQEFGRFDGVLPPDTRPMNQAVPLPRPSMNYRFVEGDPQKGEEPIPGGPADVRPWGDETLGGEERLASMRPYQQRTVKGLVEGRVNEGTINGRVYQATGMSARDMARDAALAVDPTYTPLRYKTRQEFTNGIASRNITGINTAIAHLGTLKDAAEAMKNGQVQVANSLLNRILTGLGKPQQPTLDTAKIAVGSELMRVFRGVGAGSKEEIDRWEKNFDRSLSPDQFEATIKTAVELLAGRAYAVNDTWKAGTGFQEDYAKIITPKSRDTLKKIGAAPEFWELGLPNAEKTLSVGVPSGTGGTAFEGVVPQGWTIKPKAK